MCDDVDSLLNDLDEFDLSISNNTKSIGRGNTHNKFNNSNNHANSVSTFGNKTHLLPKPPTGSKTQEKYSNPKFKVSSITNTINTNSTNSKSQSRANKTDLSIDELLEELDDTTAASPQRKAFGRNQGSGIANSNKTAISSFSNIPKNNSNDTLSSLNASKVNTSSFPKPNTTGLGSSSYSTGNINVQGISKCSRVVLSGDPNYQWGAKTSSFAKIACDNLRCMSCNFQVLIFQDCSWKTDPNIVNYMFFRNNMPNKQKLSVGLIEHHTIRKRANSSSSFSSSHIGYDLDLDEDILGEIATTRPNSGRGSNHSNSTLNSNSGPSGTAYCCQCSWVTVNQTEIDLKQVTGYVEGNPSHLKWICASH